jgi:riboflavin kinase/FMN adenylyltransferase
MAERFLVTCRGRVEHGQRLGRLLGTPTANLALPRNANLPFGTFAAVVEGLERPYRAVAHVGVRPSVRAGGEPLLEAHLLDFEGDLYGREVIVQLAHKVADEVRVDSFEALARKIADDVAAVRAYFADAPLGNLAETSLPAIESPIVPSRAV